MVRFNEQSHKVKGAIAFPDAPSYTNPIKVWTGGDPLAPAPNDAKIIDKQTVAKTKVEAELERSWEKVQSHADMWEAEEYRHRVRIRKELLFLSDKYNENPELEFFIDPQKNKPYRSFENLLKRKNPELHNKLDIQFRAARVERDLGIPIGAISFKTLNPLFFAMVYQPKGITRHKGQYREPSYGSKQDPDRLSIQKEAFELACQKAGVERLTQPELKKLKHRHVKQAVEETKAKYPDVLSKKNRRSVPVSKEEIERQVSDIKMRLQSANPDSAQSLKDIEDLIKIVNLLLGEK
jgi:hypothetical protein